MVCLPPHRNRQICIYLCFNQLVIRVITDTSTIFVLRINMDLDNVDIVITFCFKYFLPDFLLRSLLKCCKYFFFLNAFKYFRCKMYYCQLNKRVITIIFCTVNMLFNVEIKHIKLILF